MAEALTLYEASLCPDCKTHGHLAFDPFNTGKFQVDDNSLQCVVCEALEQHAENTKSDDMWPGTKLQIIRAEGL